MFSYRPRHTDEQVLDDQLKLIYNSSLRTKGCSLEDLPEEMDDRDKWRERESGKFMLAAQHDDDIYHVI